MFEHNWKRAARASLRERLGPNWRKRLPPDIGDWQDCAVRLDRLRIRSTEFPKAAVLTIPGLRITRDVFLRGRQATFKPYARVCELHSNSGWRMSVEYDRIARWVAFCMITLVADDQKGLQPTDVFSILELLPKTELALVELAFDFEHDSDVTRQFVEQHAIFGKSRLRRNDKYPGSIWYGARRSPKMVRAYWKPSIHSFRVELEMRSRWLRQYGIATPFDFAQLVLLLPGRQIKFVRVDWNKIGTYLRDRGLSWRRIVRQAQNRCRERGLSSAQRYLRRHGVFNVYRFLVPIATNRRVRQALRKWSKEWPTNSGGVL